MKKIKNILAFLIVIIGLFAFKKTENHSILVNGIEKETILKTLSAQEFGCRPLSEFNFYVETAVLKKYRGYAKIEAKIFVLDKLSNQKQLLASEEIIVANHKDSLINYDKITNDIATTELENGHIIIHKKNSTAFGIKDLISYELIYNRYIIATNNLLTGLV